MTSSRCLSWLARSIGLSLLIVCGPRALSFCSNIACANSARIHDTACSVLVLVWSPDEWWCFIAKTVVLATVAATNEEEEEGEKCETDDEYNHHCDPSGVGLPPMRGRALNDDPRRLCDCHDDA